MLLIGKKIAFGLTSSQYAFEKTIPQISKLINEGAEIIPIMSYDAYSTDTKFGKAKDFVNKIEEITLKKIIYTNEKVEDIDNLEEIDIMVICPCSRKHYWQICLRNNGYTSFKNYEKNLKKR